VSKVKVTLQCLDSVPLGAAARKMHKYTLTMSHLPRPGDFIKDSGIGYAEVVRVVFDIEGDITLIIQ
jgi:hypothetical protein